MNDERGNYIVVEMTALFMCTLEKSSIECYGSNEFVVSINLKDVEKESREFSTHKNIGRNCYKIQHKFKF